MTAPLNRNLSWSPIAIAGGLNDSKPIPGAGDLQQLNNWTLFRGRFALRGPLVETVQLVDDGVPTAVTSVLAMEYHVANLYVVAHSTVTNKTYLFKLKTNGNALDDAATEAPLTTLWTGAGVPRPVMVSFEGGSATAGVQRVYVADTTGTYNPVYYDTTGDNLVEVKEDFDDDGTKENLSFPLIFEYNDHLFGTDFRQSGALIPGLLRFSQPGLIPANEPGVTNNPLREWWNSDRRQVGSRGDKIIGVGDAGKVKILAKRRRLYSLAGFDAASWVLTPVASGKTSGIVGPHAIASLPDGTAMVWTNKGPQLTDGQGIKDIGGQIKRRVVGVTFSADTCLEYSPDDGLCYVSVADDGGDPHIYYAWDVEDRRWVGEGSWLANGGSALRAVDLRAIPDDVLPGPAAAPSGVGVVVTSDVALTVNWTNGDTALDTVTDIHRDTSSGFTPGAGNLVTTVASGVATYLDTGRTSKTTYYYKLIHRRNGQSSSASVEASGKTAVRTPNPCTAQTISGGIRVTITQNEPIGTPDIVIERRPPAGGWSTLTTLVDQTTGAKTHDDLTATSGVEYDYRCKCTDTDCTDSPYSNEATATADQTALDVTGCAHVANLVAEGVCSASTPIVDVTWTVNNAAPGDTAKIYQDDNGGGYVLRATVPLTDLSYTDTWPFAIGAAARTLRYKVEGWEGGTVLIDSEQSTLSNESVTDCIQV